MKVFGGRDHKYHLYIVVGPLVAAGLLGLAGTWALSRLKAARWSSTSALMTQAVGALEKYRDACGRAPTTAEGLQALVQKPAICTHWAGPYLRSIETDSWHRALKYTSDGTAYQLISFGRDGKPGGDGADKDIEFDGQ